ncbi:hypothetical protein AVEN_76832-1, partial [Araneus ventricosus]
MESSRLPSREGMEKAETQKEEKTEGEMDIRVPRGRESIHTKDVPLRGPSKRERYFRIASISK